MLNFELLDKAGDVFGRGFDRIAHVLGIELFLDRGDKLSQPFARCVVGDIEMLNLTVQFV